MIGDLGGVYELFILIFAVFLSPWSDLMFHLKAIEKLYTVQTKQIEIYKKTNIIESKETKNSWKLVNSVKLSIFKKIKLFLMNQFDWSINIYKKKFKLSNENESLLKIYS